MAQVTLLPQTGTTGVGPTVFISSGATEVNLQCSPQVNIGFSGMVFIEGSSAPSPGANDWFPLVTLAFTNHTNILDFNLFVSNNPWLRASIKQPGTLGAVSVYMAY